MLMIPLVSFSITGWRATLRINKMKWASQAPCTFWCSFFLHTNILSSLESPYPLTFLDTFLPSICKKKILCNWFKNWLAGRVQFFENPWPFKRGMTIQISPAPNRRHSKMCRDFWKKLLICIFGCPKLYLGLKKLKKKKF